MLDRYSIDIRRKMMSSTLTEKICSILKSEPKVKFTANELARKICIIYREELAIKRNNPRFKNEEKFILQIAAEIGSHKKSLQKIKNIIIEEQKKPYKYYYDESYNDQEEIITVVDQNDKEKAYTEKDLYPILAGYLYSQYNILTKRIDEQKSKNNKGPNGNKWLHPDLVGIEILNKEWNNIVTDCIKGSGGNPVKLYSYEVKKVLTPTNLRESFFQTVSNSSWSNLGYLVAAEIKGNIFNELKMLSSLHGIGFILLDIKNPAESQVLLQSNYKESVDWESVNRLVTQNSDYFEFIQSLKVFYESKVIKKGDWILGKTV